MTDEWYRSGSWNQEEFEQRLARSRLHSRPQYLRVKGLALLDAGDAERRRAAIGLLTRLYEDYADDQAEQSTAPDWLGLAYEADGQFETAADFYFQAVERQRTSNVRSDAPFHLADVVLREGLTDWYGRTFEIFIDPDFDRLDFDWHRFERAKTIALLADRLGDHVLASTYAQEALDLAAAKTEPEFSRHPDVGLIETDDSTVAALRRLVSAAP